MKSPPASLTRSHLGLLAFSVPIVVGGVAYDWWCIFRLDRWEPDLGGRESNFRLSMYLILPCVSMLATAAYVGGGAIRRRSVATMRTGRLAAVSLVAGLVYEAGNISADYAIRILGQSGWHTIGIAWLLLGPVGLGVSLLRTVSSSTPGHEARAPERSSFTTDAEWLSAWAKYRWPRTPEHLRARVPPGTDAVYLFGSIGLDTCVGLDGSFWVHEYDLSTIPDAPQWARADVAERLRLFAILSRDLYPEFKSLLNAHERHGPPCWACAGTGTAETGVCPVCRGAGW